jgi:uncharacterized membrane protein YfcA
MDTGFPLAGFVVGTLVGMTGVGGGALMTPLLMLLFGISPSVAVGTDLLHAALTKSAGTVVHARHGSGDWATAARLASGSLPAAAITVFLLSRWDVHSPAMSGLISTVLGGALLVTAVALLFRRRLLVWASSGRTVRLRQGTPALFVTGAVLGVVVSLTSVGAGALGVTALLLLRPHLPAVRMVGTDIAHAAPLALVAGLGHWHLGSVDWALLGSLLLGSLPGIWLGSRLANKVPEAVLRPALATLLVIIGGRLALPALA